MKNARKYELKVRKLLKGTGRLRQVHAAACDDPIETLLVGILEADSPRKRVGGAMASMAKEFVDFNELRAAPVNEIAEAVGSSYPGVKDKARMIREVLNAIYRRRNSLDVDYMNQMAKRDLRRHLRELGLGPYPVAYFVLMAFAGHAVCVDDMLVGCLEMVGHIAPGSELSDVQGFLERIVQQKDALVAHEALRAFTEKHASALARKRRAGAAAAEKAKKEAKARAEARRRQERKRAAKKAKRKKKAAEKIEKTKKAKGAEKPKKRKSAKSTARAAKRIVPKSKPKKAAKKPAKKPTKKPAGKAARKTAGKTPKKTKRKRS